MMTTAVCVLSACVAEAMLQKTANVGGDEVGSCGGIAVVQDADDRTWIAGFHAFNRREKVVEAIGRNGEELLVGRHRGRRLRF